MDGAVRRSWFGSEPPSGNAWFADLERDVREGIAEIKASPFILRKASVRGFVYDVKTGELREVS